jgi:hypothetical protein
MSETFLNTTPTDLPKITSDRRRQSYAFAEEGNIATRVVAPPLDFGSVGNLNETLNSTAVLVNRLGHNTMGFHCSPPTGGAITFETSYDGINWEETTIRGVTTDTLSSEITTAGRFIASISTNRAVRFKTSAVGSAPGTVMGRTARDASVIETIEFGHPPHKMGYPEQRRWENFSAIETDTIIWAPATGKAIVLTDIFVFAHGSTDGLLTIFSDTNENGNRIYNNEIKVATNTPLNFSHPYKVGLISGVDEAIKITTSHAIECNIGLFGYEI